MLFFPSLLEEVGPEPQVPQRDHGGRVLKNTALNKLQKVRAMDKPKNDKNFKNFRALTNDNSRTVPKPSIRISSDPGLARVKAESRQMASASLGLLGASSSRGSLGLRLGRLGLGP